MAIAASQVPVTNTPTLIVQNTAAAEGNEDFRTRRYVVKNVTGTAAIFLGGSGVSTGGGFQWDVADGALEVELEPGESLYGIVAATNQTTHVLAGGR